MNNFRIFALEFVVIDLFKNDYGQLATLCYLQLILELRLNEYGLSFRNILL